jgi:hypothetical protein
MRTRALRRLTAAASLAGALLVSACGDFNVTNPNQPTLDDLVTNPTRTKLSTAATGLFIGARRDIRDFIWRAGSMGREGILLTGNNQPDYQEPYFGPLSPTGFGRFLWDQQYRQVRNASVYLDAVPKAGQLTGAEGLSAGEVSASLGFGRTLKALALIYVIASRGSLGAPVDVDRPISDPPAPFVSEDSVYGYILGLLNDAQTDLTAAGATFPFPTPPGFTGFNTPATFLAFNRALAAKAYLYRATDTLSTCDPTACYNAALAAIAAAGPAFSLDDPSQFTTGVYYDFSNGAGDLVNDLSDALDAPNYFALPLLVDLAQKQADGTTPDQRVLDKTTAATKSPPQQIAGMPITGTLKFTIYLTNLAADPSHPIPAIRNEELVLLRAEANIGLNNLGAAVTDIDFIRTNAGKLPTYLTAHPGPPTHDALLAELLYNRRYSLLWEQGATWVDARRYDAQFHTLSAIPIPPGFANSTPPGSFGTSAVPNRMPVPASECNARGFATPCDPVHQQ